jgi:heme/copper-type cytochrome/quinol oxidase subunit 2
MTYGKLALTAVTLLLSTNSVLYMSKHGNPFSWSWDAPDGWRFLSILTTVVATIIIIVFIVLFICEHWNTPIRKKKE